MSDPGCLFCRLTRGEGEVSVVHEDERVVVFMDIQPVVRGHLLVVPRVHATSLAELDPEAAISLRINVLGADTDYDFDGETLTVAH